MSYNLLGAIQHPAAYPTIYHVWNVIPVAGLGFGPSPITISEPVLWAQTSSCSLAAALKVSPAAISTYNMRATGKTCYSLIRFYWCTYRQHSKHCLPLQTRSGVLLRCDCAEDTFRDKESRQTYFLIQRLYQIYKPYRLFLYRLYQHTNHVACEGLAYHILQQHPS